MGMTETETGIRMLPMMVFGLFAMGGASMWYYRSGSFTRQPLLGFLLVFISCIGYGFDGAASMDDDAMIIWSLPFGLGMGLASMATMQAQHAVHIHAIDRDDTMTASIIVMMAMNWGAAMGYCILRVFAVTALPLSLRSITEYTILPDYLPDFLQSSRIWFIAASVIAAIGLLLCLPLEDHIPSPQRAAPPLSSSNRSGRRDDDGLRSDNCYSSLTNSIPHPDSMEPPECD
jgi:hypothetical protein